MSQQQEIILNKLDGYSGCEILLCQNNNKNFVKKIAPLQYNNRLEKQCIKQRDFFSNTIKTPKIYRSGYQNKIFSYEMEYVPGLEFYNFVQNKTIKEITFFFEKILDFIYLNNNIDIDCTKQIFKKIDDIEKKIDKKYYYFLDFCRDSDWKNVKASYCHGDLTFENILIYDNEIYFIDFLDSFINSKLVDVSKLLQDIIIFWSYRNRTKELPYIKHIKLLEIIKSRLSVEEYQLSLKLLVINLLRIIPYSDKKDEEFLFNNLLYMRDKAII
jgi:thiamine kinase-like enzyme